MNEWPEIAGSGGLIGLLLVVLIIYRRPILETLRGTGDPMADYVRRIAVATEQIAAQVERIGDELHDELQRQAGARAARKARE